MTKKEKIERLITINYVSYVSLKHHEDMKNKTAKRWSHKGLDRLTDLWHKYYNNDSHACIMHTMFIYAENQINLDAVENALKGLKVNEEK